MILSIDAAIQRWRLTPKQFLLKVVVIPMLLFLTARMIVLGQLNALSTLVIVAALAFFLFKHPLVGLFLWMVVDTSFLEFIDLTQVPYLQFAPGLRINLSDALLVMLLLVAITRLMKRRERPLFFIPFICWMIMVTISYVMHFLLGNTDIDSGMNVLRILIGYSTYLIYIAIIEDRRTLQKVVRMWLFLMVVSVGVQLVELVLGSRLSLRQWGFGVSNYFGRMIYVDVGSQQVPYLWNRAWTYSQIGLFLSMGALFEVNKRLRRSFFVLTIVGVLGVLIALIRQVYVLLALSVAALQVFQRKRLRSIVLLGLIVAVLCFLAAIATSWTKSSYEAGPLRTWGARAGMLPGFQSDPSFNLRASENARVWSLIMRSPFIGLGPGLTWQQLKGNDVGVLNAVLLYGFPGFVIILFVWVSSFWHGYRLLKRLPTGLDHGYVAGALVFLLGVFAISMFGSNYMTGGTTVAIVMALVDRINAFSRTGSSA